MRVGGTSKGIKLIKSCYPDTQFETVIHSSLDSLIKYVLMNPGKLGEIGKFLEKRVRKCLIRGRFGHVKVSLEIFNSILNSTHANQLTFYAPNLVSVLRELLDPSADQRVSNASLLEERQKIRFQAVDTFSIFANVRYRHALVDYKDMGFFLDYFVRMAEHTGSAAAERRRMRIHGLKGLHYYISTVDDLDGFVSKYIDLARKTGDSRTLISTILDNMVAYRDEDTGYLVTPEEAVSSKMEASDSAQEANIDNVYRLATICLSDLSRSASASTVSALLNAVLQYLNEKGGWTQENFANSCIRALWEKQTSQNAVTIAQLLYQLDAVNDEKVKVHIVDTIKFFLQEISRGPIGSVIEVLLPIARQLTASTYRTADKQTPTDNAVAFESAIVQCVEVIGMRVSDPTEKLEAMTFLIDRLRDCPNAHTTSMLLQCVLQVALHIKELPAKGFHKVFEPLLKIAADKDHEGTRLTVQRIIHSLLLPSGHPDAKGVDKLYGALRASLFQTTLLHNNQPENFEAIFKTFRILLMSNRSKELEHSIPIMFQLEGVVASESSLKPHLARCVHSLVAAYFIQVGKLYASSQLEEYIRQTMEGDWSPALELKDDNLVALHQHFKKKHLETEPVASGISSDSVISILGNIHLLTRDYANKDLKAVFLLDPSQSLNLPSTLSRLRSDSMTGLRLSRADMTHSHDGLRPGTPSKHPRERGVSQAVLVPSDAPDRLSPSSSPRAHQEELHDDKVTAQLLRDIFEAEKDKDDDTLLASASFKGELPVAAPPPPLTYQQAIALSAREERQAPRDSSFLEKISPPAPVDRFSKDSLSPQSLLRMRFPSLTHATVSV
eukprot:TRINITY_DN9631_c0_g1_i3.p1 TRINITY_DN9631_c0_g1~~TRINITY_DN9631_c0_g1_i3.p1  ORF type:complete len:838 (+),score=329.99 TRINITY_DN9631_c0_g1_i3:113-2626(+)